MDIAKVLHGGQEGRGVASKIFVRTSSLLKGVWHLLSLPPSNRCGIACGGGGEGPRQLSVQPLAVALAVSRFRCNIIFIRQARLTIFPWDKRRLRHLNVGRSASEW